MIKNVSFNNIELKHPGGGNPLFAKVTLNELDRVSEEKTTYPEFSKFKELPAWGIYIRHASDIKFNNVKLSCGKKDYRTAIVVDDVQRAEFITTTIKEVDKKKPLYEKNSSGIIFK